MANATILYACTAHGLAIFNKPGTLNEWLPPRVAFPGQAVVAAWAEPGPPIRVVAAVSGAGESSGHIMVSENGGRDWESRFQGPVTALFGIEGSPAMLYAGLEGGGMVGSADGGNDWGILPVTSAGTIRSIFSTNEPGLFYLIADSPDGGRVLLEGNPEEGTWRTLPADDPHGLSWDPATGDLYAATPQGVEMSIDGGATWALLPGSPEGAAVLTVIPGPADANPSIVVGTPRDLLVSSDAGASWENLGFPQPGASAIVRDPERRDRFYVATSGGHIYESGNRGQTWQPVTQAPLAAISYLFVVRF